METTIAGLKEIVFAAGEIIIVETRVSGAVKKGGELICALPLIEYELSVDVSGVAVSELSEKIPTANLTVRSQQLIKQWAVQEGTIGTVRRLGAHKVEATVSEPVSKYTGGVLKLTWAELFPTARTKVPVSAEAQITGGFARLSYEQKLAVLIAQAESMGMKLA